MTSSTPQNVDFDPLSFPNLRESSFTYAAGKTLAYLSAGPEDGPLMIFMHGWPAIGQTWHPQLSVFARLGFKVVAPDMPGYGKSSHDKGNYADYSLESNVNAMVHLLSHLSRPSAVWIGHDWGCGPLWGLASHHPEICEAVISMTLPYRIIELGLEEEIKYVNRTMYPEERFPYGQWGYQAYYEQSFDKATSWLERDTAGVIKMFYSKGDPKYLTEPYLAAADTIRTRGRMGGAEKPPSVDQVPDDISIIDEKTRRAVTEAMLKTGWWAANAWYMNHAGNRQYMLENSVNGGKLDMPVLFIEALYDGVCSTATTNMMEPTREFVKDWTYVSVKAGHWVALEKSEEVNAAITKFLVEKVANWWPKVEYKS